MSAESHREESVFDEARQIQDRAARRAYLDQACAGDATLRAAPNECLDVGTQFGLRLMDYDDEVRR